APRTARAGDRPPPGSPGPRAPRLAPPPATASRTRGAPRANASSSGAIIPRQRPGHDPRDERARSGGLLEEQRAEVEAEERVEPAPDRGEQPAEGRAQVA